MQGGREPEGGRDPEARGDRVEPRAAVVLRVLAGVDQVEPRDPGEDRRREQERDGQVALEVEARGGATTSTSSVADMMTLDGDLVGTPSYMAPEQAEGRLDKIDERTDVYALGVVLYQLLCGEVPYTGGTVFELIAAIAEGNVEPPSRRAPQRAVPHDLEAIAMKAIARNEMIVVITCP